MLLRNGMQYINGMAITILQLLDLVSLLLRTSLRWMPSFRVQLGVGILDRIRSSAIRLPIMNLGNKMNALGCVAMSLALLVSLKMLKCALVSKSIWEWKPFLQPVWKVIGRFESSLCRPDSRFRPTGDLHGQGPNVPGGCRGKQRRPGESQFAA